MVVGDPLEWRWLEALWGKSPSRGGGRRHLLLAHMLDTAAVAECMWDRFLAPVTRRLLDSFAGGPGRGRSFFAWLCGIHDFGKAVPAFQCVDEDCARLVWDAGLRWDRHRLARLPWRHDKAGAVLLLRYLPQAGWSEEHVGWVWPLIAGHHGAFPGLDALHQRASSARVVNGVDPWPRTQETLLRVFTEQLGYRAVAEAQPVAVPSRAVQLQLAGLVVMADWIASNTTVFAGLDELASTGIQQSRDRAAKAWRELCLRGGWGARAVPGPEAFRDRFGQDMRPSQAMVVDAARRMPGPGLLVIEAPMGEGKTKAALLAAEILAARFGADGVFVGMPTQATCDPMFSQVREWVAATEPGLENQVALLHGKRRLNKQWRALLESAGEAPIDDYCVPDDDAQYGMAAPREDSGEPDRLVPAEWFLGAKRGLLCPFVVGTIDQLLFAATRTKHVMLRMAGLIGKVVVLDEIHACDVYMSQFLEEGLRWLGQARVPVVLLSATLPPEQRERLIDTYVSGAAGTAARGVAPVPRGYPSVTAVPATRDGREPVVEHTESWRPDQWVRVGVLDETPHRNRAAADSAERAVADLLDDRLREGGCALVIRNTVDRAQATYRALAQRFGPGQVDLLHGRLHAGHRAERTEANLARFGPDPAKRIPRGTRRVLVATSLAEQSFDVDADLLVTDLAPIDLVLQRIGRLHRHDLAHRPAPLRTPEVVVTGLCRRGAGPPWLVRQSAAIYGEYLLLRSAALVAEADGGAWRVPSQVPELVSAVYGGEELGVPPAWAEAERAARDDYRRSQADRIARAEPFRLARRGEEDHVTLAGLHIAAHRDGLGEQQFQALVRDGDPSVEAVLVAEDHQGYHTLAGRRLGVNGDVAAELLDEVVAATVRLPSSLTEAAEKELRPLPAWHGHPWLRNAKALVLRDGRSDVLGTTLAYDDTLGLVVNP
ncbi:CRISPR-associated helicase Cas3' [Saccharomonospora xinjiangensis]|uniref:CRISPR-associated helicase Cas3' n=1 Tax=Saccharomonospora xinjiangensis TaxID=75294 RepID=UPI0035100485